MGNNKLFGIILIALLGLSALLSVLYFVGVISEGILIAWCYVLFGAATLIALVVSVIGMMQNPKSAKNALIGGGSLITICLISYFMSSGVETLDHEGKLLATATGAQMSEAGLIAFYFLIIGAIGVIIFSEVSKMFK